jgi:hypothetical protein
VLHCWLLGIAMVYASLTDGLFFAGQCSRHSLLLSQPLACAVLLQMLNRVLVLGTVLIVKWQLQPGAKRAVD